ncbi:DnaJ-domain-containing protein [Panus rudis PR-1116 ss-1]|nr:DnaJ-domain-containing protein [Panus rudis PR-1116 ss-1]
MPAEYTVHTNLYEVLGIQKNASPEDVRKAYRKRALQTHPDRLPQGTTPEQKDKAEEQFRLVNNAYEVLNDQRNRELYDKHGVWPPPTEEPRTSHRDDSGPGPSFDPFINDPFFNRPFGARRGFMFTDPFELFNSIFGDLHGHFDDDPFIRDPFPSIFGRDPFTSQFGRDPFGGSFMSPFGPGFPFGRSLLSDFPTDMGSASTRSFVSSSVGINGQWVSQSKMTRTINGRTETIITKKDAQGNEHVTYLSPDGERHTINGVEQSTQRAIPAAPRQDTNHGRQGRPPAITDTQPAQIPYNNNAPGSWMYGQQPYVAEPQQYATTGRPSYKVPISEPAPRRSHSSRSSTHSHPPGEYCFP